MMVYTIGLRQENALSAEISLPHTWGGMKSILHDLLGWYHSQIQNGVRTMKKTTQQNKRNSSEFVPANYNVGQIRMIQTDAKFPVCALW